MEIWLYGIGGGLLAFFGVLIGLGIWLARRIRERTETDRKALAAKHAELCSAVIRTYQLFGHQRVADEEAYALLMEATTRLWPADWMVGSRRVISESDYLARYAEGCRLVKQARERAGV
jgi:hypothetical protein